MGKIGNAVIWLLALLLISFTGIGTAAPNLSNSDGKDWQYYREITIKENSGKNLIDYQVVVNLDSTNFPINAQNSGADIRFTDANNAELNYLIPIENWDYINKSGKIWVRVPNIPASSEIKIKMYYGNPSAVSSSDGTKTFDFFDDFVGTSLNTNWYVVPDPSKIIPNNGILTMTVGAIGLQNALPFDLNDDYILEGRVRYGTVSTVYSGTLEASSSRFIEDSNDNSDSTIVYMRDDNNSLVKLWIGNGKGYIIKKDVFNSADNMWYILGIGITPSTVRVWKDNVLQDTHSITLMKKLNYISLGRYNGIADKIQETSYDWVRIRKYISSEPTINIGPETTLTQAPTFTPTIPQPAPISQYISTQVIVSLIGAIATIIAAYLGYLAVKKK